MPITDDLKHVLPDFCKMLDEDEYLPVLLKEKFLKEAESWDNVLLTNIEDLKEKIKSFGHRNKMKSKTSGDFSLCYGHCMTHRAFVNYYKRQSLPSENSIPDLHSREVEQEIDEFFMKDFDEQKMIINAHLAFYQETSWSIYKWCFSEDSSKNSITLPIVDDSHARKIFPRLAIQKKYEWMYEDSIWISFRNADGDIKILKPNIFDGGSNALDRSGNWYPGGYTSPENPHQGVPEYIFGVGSFCMNKVCSRLVKADI